MEISTSATPGVGPNEFGYVAQQVTATSDTFTGGKNTLSELHAALEGSQVITSDDVGNFTFSFFGETYNQFRVHLDGLITLGMGEQQVDVDNPDLTVGLPLEPTIAVLWDNLAADQSGGDVFWEVLGSGSSERLLVEWHNVAYFDDLSPTGNITFQAVLYANGKIQFNYVDITANDQDVGSEDNGGEATVGIAGHVDLHWSFDDLDDGRYVVELLFAEIDPTIDSGDRAFDVIVEGKTVLNNYDVFGDFARIVSVPGSQDALDVDTAGGTSPAGIVKRFEIDVVGGDGLQIDLVGTSILNGLRILQGDAPRVNNVVVQGSGWSNPNVAYSFNQIVGAGAQLRPIATQTADTIQIHFDSPVTVAIDDLVLAQTRWSGANVVNTDLDSNDVSSFSYDPVNYIATWEFTSPLSDGKYAIHLNGVTGSNGQLLDGDWKNDPGVDALGRPTWDDYADDPAGRLLLSGDGAANSANNKFQFDFALLAGDYDGNGIVDSQDVIDANDPYSDGNGDGLVNSQDTAIVTAILNSGVDSILPLRSVGGGDFFNDEVIDGKDLEIWQDGYGGHTEGDADGDGDVDGQDFLFWQRMFGVYSAWGTPLSNPVSEFSYAAIMAAELGVSLEDLTEGLPPQVVDVIVSGSLSAHDPYSYVTEGADGSGDQLVTVPVALADTISIVFSEAVNVPIDSLIVVGLTTANLPQLAEFSYDAATYTASWRFEGWALGDNYLLYLKDNVTDVDGNFLDGEWTNPESMTTVNGAISTFPSGDGTGGGTFNFAMTLLPGDANLDGVVDSDDQTILSSYIGTGTLFIHGDFNGSGSVDWHDASYLGYAWGVNLQEIFVLADLDGDGDVDSADLAIIGDNYGMTGADREDGDLNGDQIIDDYDLDLAFAQYGLWLDWVA